MSRIELNGQWKMAVIHHGDLNLTDVPCRLEQVVAVGAIDATVPGNFELDLERAGIIPDPFYGKNLLNMLAYEDAHVFYARTFHYTPMTGTPELVFEGIDTIGDVYINGEHIGRVDNMFIPHRLELPALIDGENEIVVHLLPACLEARKNDVSAAFYALKYNYETLRLRKAPHMFGWDIMPRLVSAGIYRMAGIEERPAERFAQLYFMTKKVDVRCGTAEVDCFFNLDIGDNPMNGYRMVISGRCGDSVFSLNERLWFTAGKMKIKLDNAKFWWPKGYGDANLYDVVVTLERNGVAVHSRSIRLGVRTVELVRTSTTDMLMSGEFYFKINGKRVFVLGTNWVPVDAYHARDVARIPKIMELLDDVGCNAVRCWGGNVYEDPIFYRACDEMGIMVWQDFAMGCATYPIDEAFCEVMRREAIEVVRMLRQHPSIILWSGDNECDAFTLMQGGDPNQNHVTRRTLADVTAFEDPTRPYLPSSPYIDEAAWKLPMSHLTEFHLWGPRDYYKSEFFKGALCNFVSEIGYHGSPSVASIKKFISPEALWPWQDNDEWKIHAASPETDDNGPYIYRIELMAKQIKELFGRIPENLEDFVLASQISQAEAKKFFVELFRTGQPKRSGIIWWNLIDGWPQFSDAVVDYYYDKKLAYHYIKQSQRPLLLTFTEPRAWKLRLVAVNNAGKTLAFDYQVKDYHSGETLLSGKGSCEDALVVELDALPYSLGEKRLYVIEWTCGEHSGKNHYLAGNPPFELEDYRSFLADVYGMK